MSIIDQIVNNIIRPTRDQYHLNRLGHSYFSICIQQQTYPVNRYDQKLLNKNKQNIQLSYYANSAAQNNSCVIYLHANNGSRVQGLQYLSGLLNAKFNVCLFDFSGSGLSGGDYISLGPKQSYDLECVINFLRYKMNVKRFILWGRSMGATTALIYANRHPEFVQGLILDSPFKDLKKLIKQLGAERTCFPKCFFQPLMPFINEQLYKKIGYTLDDYKLKKYLFNLDKLPVLFLVSKQDKLVKPHHGEKLYTRYPAKNKHLEYIDIQHHENRTNQIIYKCISFIKFALAPKIKTTLSHRKNQGNITSRTMNSSSSQTNIVFYQGTSFKGEYPICSGSTISSMKQVSASQKLQKVQSKLSLKAHSEHKQMKEGRNDKMDLKPKISLANFMKK